MTIQHAVLILRRASKIFKARVACHGCDNVFEMRSSQMMLVHCCTVQSPAPLPWTCLATAKQTSQWKYFS